jgi:hypothetical protein
METNKGTNRETNEAPKAKKPRKPRRRKAVIDRIEDGAWAVLLVGRKEEEKVIPVSQLPEGAGEGSWLKVRLMEDGVKDIIVDEEATTAARGRVESKMELLRSRQKRFQPISTPEDQNGGNE